MICLEDCFNIFWVGIPPSHIVIFCTIYLLECHTSHSYSDVPPFIHLLSLDFSVEFRCHHSVLLQKHIGQLYPILIIRVVSEYIFKQIGAIVCLFRNTLRSFFNTHYCSINYIYIPFMFYKIFDFIFLRIICKPLKNDTENIYCGVSV